MLSSLSVCLLLGVASTGGTGSGADSPLIDDAALQNAGLVRYWQASLPLPHGDVLQEAHLVDEVLYAITRGGTLFALTADTGLLRWGAKVTEADYKIYRPTHVRTADGAGPVVIPTTTEVFVHDRFSGELIQRFAAGFAAGSPAVAYDDKLFMGSADGRFYSLHLDPRRQVKPFKRWEALAGGPVTARPLLYDYDLLLFASQSGTVYSCRAADKTLNWVFRTGGPVVADPAVDESGAYIASMDRSLYKLGLSTGRVLWRVRMQRPLVEGPVVAAHTVFQHCPDDGLIAVDADTGRVKWQKPQGRSFVAHSRNGDLIFMEDSRLDLVDGETGEIRCTLAANSVAVTVSNTQDEAVYLFGREGRAVCIRLADTPYLRHQQVLAARRRLNVPPQEKEAGALRLPKAGEGRSELRNSDPLRSRRDRRP